MIVKTFDDLMHVLLDNLKLKLAFIHEPVQFGLKILKHRISRDWTYSEIISLAAKNGLLIDSADLSAMENGYFDISIDMYKKTLSVLE